MDTDDTIAHSLDGREFHFDAPVEATFGIGMFVHLVESRRTRLGQIESLRTTDDGAVHGVGTVLGELTDGRLDRRRSIGFSRAIVTEADAAATAVVYDESPTSLRMGTLLGNPANEARVLSHRFNRHTFWCGQSGSGKTYALGVLLEQLLVHTALPMVIFDPNADFVRLREHRATPSSAAAADVAALGARDIRVLGPSADADDIHVRFRSLSLRSQAAVLRMDPLADRAEYNELVNLEVTDVSRESGTVVERLRERGTPPALTLADRIENLRLEDWRIWAFDDAAVTDIIDERPDATVLDLGGFSYPEESLVVALSVLDDLWEKRESRRPILIVIDEAHNLCSPDTDSPLHVAVRERIIQIAAEGRKFGLWLLLSTQRPSKIHPNILSQCDNLALMRMSSPLDLAELADVFGFAPPAMVMQSPRFQQGEALFAGGFVAAPTLLKVGDRLTVEGGVDVPVPQR